MSRWSIIYTTITLKVNEAILVPLKIADALKLIPETGVVIIMMGRVVKHEKPLELLPPIAVIVPVAETVTTYLED